MSHPRPVHPLQLLYLMLFVNLCLVKSKIGLLFSVFPLVLLVMQLYTLLLLSDGALLLGLVTDSHQQENKEVPRKSKAS